MKFFSKIDLTTQPKQVNSKGRKETYYSKVDILRVIGVDRMTRSQTRGGSKKSRLSEVESDNDELSASKILEYLQQNNTINIEKIKTKMKNENNKSPGDHGMNNKASDNTQKNKEQCRTHQNNQEKSNLDKKEEENKLEKVKYITTKYEGEQVKAFRHYFKLSQEIERCQKQTQIKSAYINQRNQLIIKLAEEDKYTITRNWPADAFLKGIKLIETKKLHQAAIYYADIDLDVNEIELTNSLKSKYSIIKATRLIKISTNEALNTVKLTFNDEKKYKYHLEHGIQIGYTHFKVKPWNNEKSIKQCYKCLKLGHLQFNCRSKEVKWLQCSESHKEGYSKCSKPLKWANCGQDHVACSKKCPKITEYMEKQTESKEKKNTAAINTNREKAPPSTTSNIITTQLQQLRMIQNLINRSNMTTLSFIIEILSRLNEVTESIHENNPTFKTIATEHFGHQMERHIASRLEMHQPKDELSSSNIEDIDYRNSSINNDDSNHEHSMSQSEFYNE